MSIFPADRTPSVYLDAAQALQNVGDPDALREMLVMMQDLLTRDVAQIAELMKQSDFPAAQHLLHALKGCMPIFCTSELCEELAGIELLAKSQNAAASAPVYDLLRPKLELLRTEISLHLAQFKGN